MRKKWISVLAVAVIAIGIFAYSQLGKGMRVEAFLEENDIAYDTNENLIHYLEYEAGNQGNVQAQIFPNSLKMMDGKNTVETSLKDSMFYLSFAPYVDVTHPCTFHIPTGCQGELPGRMFDVLITDNKTGEVVFEGEVETAMNGFAGVWIPRNIEATIKVSYYGQEATDVIATGSEDATCLTTLQLV